MKDGSRSRRSPAGQRQLAEARSRFLSADDVDGGTVRDTILASWRRSQRLAVAADHLPAQRLRAWDHQDPLLAAAGPVLQRLGDQLADEPVSVLLTDAEGMVLQRADSDAAIGRYLDGVALAPGFSYAESSVGTNGIGTALAERRPTWVDGFEHYADRLERLSCAGAPIHHPASGALVGAVDLTSWSNGRSALMLALASSTAERIEKAMLGLVGQADLTLFREYLSACRHTPGIVLALDRNVVMMNEAARRSLSAADQSALLERAIDVLGTARHATVVASLPSGTCARLRYRPVPGRHQVAGGVFVVSVAASPHPSPTAAAAIDRTGATPSHGRARPGLRLPGLVGTSAAWQRCARDALECRRSGEWLVLRGEPGTGKRALLAAVQKHTEPAGHFRIVDGAQIGAGPERLEAWLDVVAEELGRGTGTLAITHADRMPPEAASALGEVLQQHAGGAGGPHSSWVALTVGDGEHPTELAACLLPHFPHTVEVPALRHHSEDVPELVTALLDQLARDHRLSFDFAAVNQLSRATWPGNVTQLHKVLADVVGRRRVGPVTAADLPPETRSAVRRRLTTLESLERDAIVKSLTAHAGRKAPASAELGMSRSSIYRKIRDYGITGL
ncbi:MAG: modulated sigma54 specific transcriptional regulator, Fis family [Modestobacter sp.]|nr:modulated sigma54 specific transcriptional regulator, Fis family [Modestobacter sp.]